MAGTNGMADFVTGQLKASWPFNEPGLVQYDECSTSDFPPGHFLDAHYLPTLCDAFARFLMRMARARRRLKRCRVQERTNLFSEESRIVAARLVPC